MAEGNGGRKWTLEVQAWHIMLMLATQLVFLGIAYGRIAQAQEQTHEEIQHIESQRVITKDDFDDWKTQITGRMDRMENKLDRTLFRSDLSK